MSGCPFCTPETARVIRRRRLFTSLLSNPCVAYGHALVVPNRHVERFSQLRPLEILAIFREVIRLQRLLHQHDLGSGSDIWIKYQPFVPDGRVKVSHLHVHLIPRHAGDRLFLAEPGDFYDLSPDELNLLLGIYGSNPNRPVV